MKSKIQLFVASSSEAAPSAPCVRGTIGRELRSIWITFLKVVTKSFGDLKRSPQPEMASRGERARNLTSCLMKNFWNSDSFWKHDPPLPRASQASWKRLLLTGSKKSCSPNFLVLATLKASSWKSSRTLSLYAFSSAWIFGGSGGKAGQSSEGSHFFRGWLLAKLLGNRLRNRNR